MPLTRLFKRSQAKLIALLGFSTIIPVSIVGGYSIFSSTQALTELVTEKMENQVANTGENIVKFLENSAGDIVFLSKTPPIQGIVRSRENNGIDKQGNSSYKDWVERLEVHFLGTMDMNPYYYQIRYLDENGQEMVKIKRENQQLRKFTTKEMQTETETSFFRQTLNLQNGNIYISAVELNKEKGKIQIPYTPIVHCSTPIYSPDGKKKGMIVADILADYFFKNIDKINLNKIGQAFVVDRNGTYIYNSDKSQEKELNLEEKKINLKQKYKTAITDKILSGSKGLMDLDGEKLISYYTVIPNQNSKENSFVIVYEVPAQVIFASINQFKIVAVTIALISLGIVLIIGIIIIRKLVNSISELTNAVTTFSLQVSSTMEEQERILTQQSSSVQETTTTMNELSTSSHQSAQQALSAANGAKQALNQVETGTKTAVETLQEMAKLKEKVGEIAQQILFLSQQTNQIGNISVLVSDLANQTNMLALNASVEAVRAGDKGKGFAIVAAEIRKLADESKKSAQAINTLVTDIQKAINSTVFVSNEGTEKVDTSEKLVEKTTTTFSDVSTLMQYIAENSQQIALSAKQQAIATQQVLDAMNALTQGAAEAATSITQTKIGTQTLSQTALKLKEII